MTISPVESAYILLQLELGAASESQFISRSLGRDDVLAALDHSGGKHLLIEVDDEDHLAEDTASQGVQVLATTIGTAPDRHHFLDLQCAEPRLSLVFDRLVEDVVNRIDGESAPAPSQALWSALDDWRALLRRADLLDSAAIIGLCGELVLLGQLARNGNPHRALASWTGPSHTVHDFVAGPHAIEVKATASLEGREVEIHGLEQLEDEGFDSLHLVVAHCRKDPGAPSLDDRIDKLAELGFSKSDLIQKAAQVGYIYESEQASETRYDVRSLTCWQVSPSFPRLTKSNIPLDAQQGISRVKYQINLDALPPPLATGDAQSFYTSWGKNV